MSETIAVIGGGPAGLEAARGVAELGGSVVLIEKESFLGGTPIRENYAALTPNMEPAEVAMGRLIDGVNNAGVEVLLGHQVTACEGEAPDFRLTVAGPDGERVIECGGIIVATGFEHFDPGRETQMYGYYEHPDVLALQDLEAMLKEHNVVRPSTGLPPERICFVQCVGSRDRQIGNEYCSKVCCGVASKEAIEVRQQLPD
ncbi:MAG TPA: FAD-dependent oxidoreductase, partial [Acidimicrobiia bacterium]|nr:FAD-dependent oxidoreductase [Acidimicrobiia bacterium]